MVSRLHEGARGVLDIKGGEREGREKEGREKLVLKKKKLPAGPEELDDDEEEEEVASLEDGPVVP